MDSRTRNSPSSEGVDGHVWVVDVGDGSADLGVDGVVEELLLELLLRSDVSSLESALDAVTKRWVDVGVGEEAVLCDAFLEVVLNLGHGRQVVIETNAGLLGLGREVAAGAMRLLFDGSW